MKLTREFKLQFLPSKFYFSSATESEFQYKLNKSTKQLGTVALYLATLFLLSLTILSWLTEESDKNHLVNFLRIVMILLSITLIFINKKEKAAHLHSRFFAYAILFCLLFSYLFWVYAQTHSELNEGGPMLVAASFVAIPMLHLGHKLILWFIIGISLIGIQVYGPISIMWTIYFYVTTVIVMGSIQYQLDILLRTQYRAELNESEKAKTDQLTGVFNRHSFETKCEALIEQLQPSQYIGLAMIDIDHFKKYNDNYGHLKGDRALVKVAQILKDFDADIVVRFGGEEFILVKKLETNELDWLNDLPQKFAINAIPHKYSSFQHITVSAGLAIAEYNEKRVITKTLLTTADAVMYKAKNAGRNQILTQYIE